MIQREQFPRVAFQGERGAFSEEAAVALLGDVIQLVPRPTFEALFASIDEGIADYALVPLENSLAGSLHRSYDLLLDSSLQITAEVVIPIALNLIGCPGSSFGAIAVVNSHPVALAQCGRFFAEHSYLKRVAGEDTAGSVAEIIESGDPSRAAIASKHAARIYGGDILREHLEDHPENFTRFVLLARQANANEKADKISLIITVDHRPGALHDALATLTQCNVNLLKIESRPARESPGQYYFYLDLHASADSEIDKALAELKTRARKVRFLGSYLAARPNGNQPY